MIADPVHCLDTVGPAALPIVAQSAEGALLWDTKGRTYWDFYGGHAVTLIGQAHPRWIQAISDQARRLSFFTGLAPVGVRTRAATALCAFTGMDVAWFVNSGAEANEAALKIARKSTGRSVIVAMVGGFHGRTMGALGVTWKYREQHAPAHGDVRFVPFGDLEALAAAMDDSVAGIMVEPIQGIAGIVEPPQGYLRGVRKVASEHGALLICDEIQCGVGRAGVPLVSRAMGVIPDIVTVGKGVGGGFPVAALLLSQRLADTVGPGEHGTTFGGAPMACAAVEATLTIIESENLLRRSVEREAAMKESLMVPGVQVVRGSGVGIGLELDRPAKPVAKKLLGLGFLVGTASNPNVLRLSPPAVTPIHAVRLLADALKLALGTSADVAA